MQFTIVLIFIVLYSFSIYYKNENIQKAIFVVFSIFLIIFAGFRSPESVNDYENYVRMYDFGFDYVEPTFKLISNIVRSHFDNYIYLFLIYAIFGVLTKVFSIKYLTEFYLLSLAIYVSNFYILQELTQIRVGVASGILLMMIKPIYDRDWKLFSLLCFVAALFHYTAIILIPIYFLNPHKISKLFWILIIPISYIVHLIGINLSNLVSYIPFENVQRLWDAYTSDPDFENINVFNSVQLLRCLISFYLILFAEKIIANNIYFLILIKIYVIGIISFVLFIDLPVLSFRISELLYIVEILIIPFIIYTTENKFKGYFIVFFIGIFFLYYNLIFAKLILI